MKLSALASQDFRNAITSLMQQPLPIKTTFKLKKYAKALEAELAVFEETRTEIVKEYGEKDENGQPVVTDGFVKLDETKSEEWQKKLGDLLTLESAIESPAIKLSELGDDLKISAHALFCLGDIISED
jgi:hypothetical protein